MRKKIKALKQEPGWNNISKKEAYEAISYILTGRTLRAQKLYLHPDLTDSTHLTSSSRFFYFGAVFSF